MSFLEELITEIDQAKQPKKQSKPNQFLEFEKQLRDLAKSKGVQPRTFLEQLVKHKPELAQNKVIQKLIGEQDVPTQKGRDAKPEVLTKRAMNKVKQGIKQAANKQRRRIDKDAVEEDAEQDTEYAKMIIQQNPQEYKKFMDTGDLMDAPTVYEKLFAYFSSSDADDQMPYGTQKARDGDPYVWLTDKLDDLGLTEGNEFAQKVRQLKATGAKKGTKFKTSDGEEHTLEGDLNAWYAEQYAKELAEKDGKVWDRMPYGDKEDYRKIANKKYGVVKSEDIEGLVEKMILMKDQVADAVADRVKDWAKSASVEQINKVLTMIKSPAKLKPEGPTSASIEEDKTDAEIDAFHKELDQLVHKHFGHSSDEKREKVNNESNYGRSYVRVNPLQAKQVKVMGTVTRISGDMVTIRNDRTNKTYDVDTRTTSIVPQVDMRGDEIEDAPLVIVHQGSSYNINQKKIGQRSAMSGGVQVGDKIKLESIVESKAITEEEFDEAAGKKDACYHKVKARYKVWPSAYASGALVQCRKKGAANWGNKSD